MHTTMRDWVRCQDNFPLTLCGKQYFLCIVWQAEPWGRLGIRKSFSPLEKLFSPALSVQRKSCWFLVWNFITTYFIKMNHISGRKFPKQWSLIWRLIWPFWNRYLRELTIVHLRFSYLIPSGITIFFPISPSTSRTNGKSDSKLLTVKRRFTKEVIRRWKKTDKFEIYLLSNIVTWRYSIVTRK